MKVGFGENRKPARPR